MRLSKKTIVFAVIVFVTFYISVALGLSGAIVSAHYGFAVDANGLLYVGKSRGIDVYDSGEFVRTVYNAPRGYSFTIRDEKLYIASTSRIKVMDLSGNLIEIIDDSVWPTEEYRIDKQKKEFVTDEARYTATNIFEFYTITKHTEGGSEIVYHIPIIDYILNCTGAVFLVSIFVFLFKTIVKPNMLRKK